MRRIGGLFGGVEIGCCLVELIDLVLVVAAAVAIAARAGGAVRIARRRRSVSHRRGVSPGARPRR